MFVVEDHPDRPFKAPLSRLASRSRTLVPRLEDHRCNNSSRYLSHHMLLQLLTQGKHACLVPRPVTLTRLTFSVLLNCRAHGRSCEVAAED